MKLIASITFKQSTKTVGEITGRPMDPSMTIDEIGKIVIETEQALEKLTGLRAHISVEVDGDKR